MASILSQEIDSKRSISTFLGKQLLDVITSGMYSDPRMAIREYVQNAADAIDKAREQGLVTNKGHYIRLNIDGNERVITIEDNGYGIGGREVEAQLGSIGCSPKLGTGQRGFRGIGRLGGLTYCDLLKFETRHNEREPVHIVEWNGQALREKITDKANPETLTDVIHRIAYIGKRPADRLLDPDRFLRVSLINVHRFHSDLLMNVKSLREYLVQTAPIGYDHDKFPYASTIERYLGDVPGYQSYDLTLNGTNVVRPYQETIVARDRMTDSIHDIELLECTNRYGDLLCRGWYAKTGFLSSLPPNVSMRGIRIRQGNIAVGDEYFLKDLFSESRFTTWHIGELHVSPLLKLNARRDGFEESADYEEFLEWASVLCRRLSTFCRQSSKERSSQQTINRIVDDLDHMLSIPFFVDEEHVRCFIERAKQKMTNLDLLIGAEQHKVNGFCDRIKRLQENPVLLDSILDGRILRGKDKRQLIVDICKRIVSTSKERDYSEHLSNLLEPYLKSGKLSKGRRIPT